MEIYLALLRSCKLQKDNPRRRTMGNHAIFDYYNTCVNEFQKYGDSVQWHFHPMSTYNDAHRCATSYFR